MCFFMGYFCGMKVMFIVGYFKVIKFEVIVILGK